MVEIKRRSPVSFDARIVKSEVRDNWTVVLEYGDEGDGPRLTDLSHKARWDVQSARIGDFSPLGIPIPDAPGVSVLENGVMINRMNRTQAAIWNLLEKSPVMPEGPEYTDVTDSTVFLALFGKNVFSITEKLTALDFKDPRKKTPFLLQGPFSHVPCQLVALDVGEDRPGLLFTCSRGYAHDMVHAIMDAGAEFGPRPAGEEAFVRWIEGG
ncbi:MAG: sarcosine oxidase subunit gamma SoxG [Desulfobacterales bacterium]|nr:sarcosine oxidase subunit gamma SoxG [Desulfobacterales bacterium]